MCGYFSIGFISFMLKAKSLLKYTNVSSAVTGYVFISAFTSLVGIPAGFQVLQE